MAVTYPNATKDARLGAVITLLGAAGKMKMYTASGGTLLTTHSLANPAGTASAGVLTLDFDPDLSATAAANGTATYATLTTSADVEVVTGLTVGTSGTDVVLDNNVLTSGQTVTLATGTITHA